MKKQKYISAEAANNSLRGGSAVISAIMYTLLTAAVCVGSFAGGFSAEPVDYIIPGILAANALSLWAVLASGKKFGIGVVRIIQIIALAAAAAASAVAADVLVGKISNSGTISERFIDISLFESFDVKGMCCVLAVCVVTVLYCIAALGYVSAASRAKDGKPAAASGRALSIMSYVFGFVLIAFIPVRIFAGTIGKLAGLDVQLLGLEDMGFDFTAYTLTDYASLAASVAAPAFYLLLGNAAGKMARSKKAEEASQPEAVSAAPAFKETTAEEPAPAAIPIAAAEEEIPVRAEKPAEEIFEEPVPAAIPIAAAAEEPAPEPVYEPAPESVPEPVYEPAPEPAPAAAVAYIPGTKLIDFGYCEDDVI